MAPRSDEDVRRRPKLRDDIKIARQVQSEAVGYIVKDPLKEEYFRFDEDEWAVISLFDGEHTFEEMVEKYNSQNDDEIDVATLKDFHENLESMHLLEKTRRELNIMLVENVKEQRKSQLLSKKGSLVYKRFPLVDPNRMFNRIIPHIQFFWTKGFLILSLACMLTSSGLIIYNWDKFNAGLAELFSFSEMSFLHLATLWVVIYVTIAIHELGHGLTCKRYGGDVHEMGFLLLFFQPCLYCNVNDAWLFDKKWKQVLVTVAGGYIEFFVGALFGILWAVTNPNTFINVLSFQVMTIASISTIAFNFNPLIKLDGYYLLADYLEIPNLRENAFGYVKYLTSRYIFRMPEEEFEGTTRQKKWYFIYGVAGTFWLIGLFSGLFFLAKNFLTEQFQIAGMLLAFFLGYKLFGSQLKNGVMFLVKWFMAKKPYFIEKWQEKQIKVGAGVVGVLLLIVLFFPFSYTVPGTCTLEPNFIHIVRAQSDGRISEFFRNDGETVKPGEVVAQLDNYTLGYDREVARQKVNKLAFKVRRAMTNDQSKVRGLRRELSAKALELERKDGKLRDLTVIYPKETYIPGKLSCVDQIKKLNTYVKEGDEICRVLGTQRMKAVIEISEAEVRFIKVGDQVKFKLNANPLKSFHGAVEKIRPLGVADPKNPTSKLYHAEIFIENPGLLKPGMTGIAKIIAEPISLLAWAGRRLSMFMRLDLFY